MARRVLTKPEQHAALGRALVKLAYADAKALSALHVATIAEPLVAESRVWPYAYAIAQRLVQNLEADDYTVSGIPGPQGRVTSRRLDQRLKENRHPAASTEVGEDG